MDERKTEHPLRPLLEDIPDALELLCYVEYCRFKATGNKTPLPLKALEKCYDDLKALDPKMQGFEPACVNILEALNTEINKDLPADNGALCLRLRHGYAGSSTTRRWKREKGVSAVVKGGVKSSHRQIVTGRSRRVFEAPVQTPGDREADEEWSTIYFGRNISSEENATFISLFKVVKATPRKIKRVVNV